MVGLAVASCGDTIVIGSGHSLVESRLLLALQRALCHVIIVATVRRKEIIKTLKS